MQHFSQIVPRVCTSVLFIIVLVVVHILSYFTSYYSISNIGSVAYERSRYGTGTGPMLLDAFGCTGSEDTLISCRRKRLGDVNEYCRSSFRDVSVLCGSSKE